MQDSYLNNNGLDVQKDFSTILYHFPNGKCDLPPSVIVPLHYNYNYNDLEPNKKGLNYDHTLLQGNIMNAMKSDLTCYEEVPIIQLGQQIITFTYSTKYEIIHHIFPYSTEIQKYFWFLDGKKMRESIMENFLQFIRDVKQEKANKEAVGEKNSSWKPKLSGYYINLIKDDGTFGQELVQRIQNVFENNYKNFEYNTVRNNDYVPKAKKIICRFYKGDLFNSSFKLEQFTSFRYIKTPYIDEQKNVMFYDSQGEVTVESNQTYKVRFPLELYEGEDVGQIAWLYFGYGDMNDEKVFLGLGWFNNDRSGRIFPVRLPPDSEGLI